MSKFLPAYDLESMTEQQRIEYIAAVCNHMGVPPELNLVALVYLDENDGPRRLVAYAKRGATEIVRNNRGINVTNTESKEIGGSIVFTVTGKDSTGRQEISVGSKYIKDLTGRELDDAIMTAQTRATRRMTLQFIGAGVLDESEVNPARIVSTVQQTPIPVAPLPTVQPTTAPGKDITPVTPVEAGRVNEPTEEQKQAVWEADQAKMRADAIAFLNAKTEKKDEPVVEVPDQANAGPEPKKTRKPRAPNKPKTVDLGPSEPLTVAPAPVVAPVGPVVVAPTIASAPVAIAVAPPEPQRGLNQEQARPYRQRYFKIVNDLELLAGFAPKLSMSNPAKMTNLASLMFPDVTNMKELSAEQWEKYLTTLETKIGTVGHEETVKYIEDAIGI